MDLGTALGAGASAAAVLAALVGVSRTTTTIYRRTLGGRRAATRQLNLLACGVTRAYVDSVLGLPAFHRVTGEAEEYVYRTRHAWVQVLADTANDVARFAITITDRKLKFDIAALTFGQLRFRLLGDFFASVRQEPDGIRAFVGARRFGYAESHYFGNPGGYQHYVLAYNDAANAGGAEFAILNSAGVLDVAEGFLRPSNDTVGQFAASHDETAIQRFRDTSKPNTLIVSRPMADGFLAHAPLGVDLDHVRVLQSR